VIDRDAIIGKITSVVIRTARKMAKKYALRLSRRRAICPEDLENVGWARVLSQMNHIETLPPCDCVKIKGCTHRRAYVYPAMRFTTSWRTSSHPVTTPYGLRHKERSTRVRRIRRTQQ
jgi:hypothetical protein